MDNDVEPHAPKAFSSRSFGSSATLQKAQCLLEQNEDLIAAVVENIQMGRLDDSIKQYSLLQSNLITLALSLDNFPPSDVDPFQFLDSFPDKVMRKDILDDFRPPGLTTKSHTSNSTPTDL